MLPYENEPFANHHIEQLTKVLDTLHPEKASSDVTPLTDEEIYLAVRNARQALVRYRVCFADEVRQKMRYRDALRLPRDDK